MKKRVDKKKKITIFADFKQFILRGNILDLAVAVIIGGAFGKIVTSLVNDIIMPLISLMLGGISFSDLKWVIKEANEAEGISETALNYGNFIQTAIDFLIIAVCIFMLIRIVGNLSRRLNQLSDAVKQKTDKDGAQESTPVIVETAVKESETAPEENETSPEENQTAPQEENKKEAEMTELLRQIRDILDKNNG